MLVLLAFKGTVYGILSEQPAFKEAYRSKYEKWLLPGEMLYTTPGNMRAPSKLICVQWVGEAWDSWS